eukprot:TRINITY_DN22604_c0_g1_i1.p1 TRINITY_DN22604_c0_g1~~TRINITY_DN22604_c0_g1_i1.p1  ORF type:complete len:226 (+),score=102.80 TRINITY_DN22604_c0_g1_i1:77-754(+)
MADRDNFMAAITVLCETTAEKLSHDVTNEGLNALAVLVEDRRQVADRWKEIQDQEEKGFAKQEYEGTAAAETGVAAENGVAAADAAPAAPEEEAAAKEEAKREAEEQAAKQLAAAAAAAVTGGEKSALDVVREASDDFMKYPTTDVSNVLIKDDDIKTLFTKYDTSGNGFLERDEVMAIYNSFENFGLDDSATKVDEVLRKYSRRGDGRVDYNEFALLMLALAQR